MARSGIEIASNPRSINLIAITAHGSAGAGIYLQSACRLNIFVNSRSNTLGVGDTYGLFFDPAATYSDLLIQSNDISDNVLGAVAGATPSPAATMALSRNNRSFSPVGSVTPAHFGISKLAVVLQLNGFEFMVRD